MAIPFIRVAGSLWRLALGLPLAGEVPGAWGTSGGLRNQCGRLAGLYFVGITVRDGALRDTVGSEDNRQLRTGLAASFVPSLAKFLAKGLDKEGMVVPGFDKVENKRGIAVTLHCFTVEPNARTRVLWGQADSYHALQAIGRHLLYYVRDERFPIPHRN